MTVGQSVVSDEHTQMRKAALRLVQIDKDEANAYVERHHRHSNPVLQHKFSLGALADDEFVGVAIVEWPKARKQADGWTCEVTRVCTTGYPNACFRNSTELVLLGERGKADLKRRDVGTWHVWKNPRQNSAKPEGFLDLVESVSHPPYLEMFARRARFGWDYWGNESLGTAGVGA